MSDKYFLDTNIFVYSFDSGAPQKQKTSQRLIREALSDGNGFISYQVVQEFLNVATKEFATPLTAQDAQIFLATVLQPLCPVFSSIEMYHDALIVADRWKYSFYDALIIAAATKVKATILYTEDLQSGQMIDGLRIVNPFE